MFWGRMPASRVLRGIPWGLLSRGGKAGSICVISAEVNNFRLHLCFRFLDARMVKKLEWIEMAQLAVSYILFKSLSLKLL
jgi:hypothetical protein